jgi:hypothetical protein
VFSSPCRPQDRGGGHNEGKFGYRPEYCRIAQKMYEQGVDDADVADAFEVPIKELRKWCSGNAEFSDACKLGKGVADSRVQRSLFKRAVGYEREVEKVLICKGGVVVVRVVEEVKAEVSAGIFWLINRRKNKWTLNPNPDPDSEESPLDQLRRELSGTALKPVVLPPPTEESIAREYSNDWNGGKQEG